MDGRKRLCSSKAFELLLLLAQNPGRLFIRDEMLDALWPGGQVASDEALTQVIFRARAAIEPYAHHIQTLRGKGLRLDGDVIATARHTPALFALESANEPRVTADQVPVGDANELPVSKPADHSSVLGSKWRTGRIAVLMMVLLTMSGVFLATRPPADAAPQLIDEGYGLFAADLLTDWSDSRNMIAVALQNEAMGQRDRAELLLEAVHKKDSHTPIPALFLALWAKGEGKIDRADNWLQFAGERLALTDSVYLKLLYDYISAQTNGSPQQMIDQAGALLDIRPNAWRMHHARAHLMESIGMRDAALLEIQQIDVKAYGNRKLEMVIADRASFGDVPGAQAALDRLGPASSPAVYAFLSGRIAWSRGDLNAAFESFDKAGTLSYGTGRLDIYRRSLMYAGALEVLAGQDHAAIERLELARGAVSNASIIDEVDIALLLAQLHAKAGEFQQMDAELNRALAYPADSVSVGMAMAAGLVAFRLKPSQIPTKPSSLPPEYDALWRGFESYAAAQFDSANKALAESQLLGIHASRMSDEARWLELQLGQPVAPEARLDPPYPPLSRVALRRDLRKSKGSDQLD